MKFFGRHWHWFRKDAKQSSKIKWAITAFFGFVFLAANLVLHSAAGHFLNSEAHNLKPLYDNVLAFLPVVDLRFLTRNGILVSLLLITIGFMHRPSHGPYLLFLLPWWLFWRTVFMVLSPADSPVGMIADFDQIQHVDSIWQWLVKGMYSRHVLFFSGHLGLSLLGCLIFRRFFAKDEFRPVGVGFLFIPGGFLAVNYWINRTVYPLWLGGIILAGILTVFLLRRNTVMLHVVFIVWTVVMGTAVLLTRQHYSVDVVGAFFITFAIWYWGSRLFGGIERLCATVEDRWENYVERRSQQ